MKKVIFALAAVVALAACSKEQTVSFDKGAAIGFDTFVENSTRSVVDPSYSNSNMFNDFAVFGYVNGAVLFDGVRVARTGIDNDELKSVWKYEGTQYWIADANYNFNAVAPKTDGNWTKVDADTNKDATKISFTNNDGTTDLLYAYATAVGKAGSGDAANPNNKTVGFTFRHVLSKVKFSFENKYNASNATIRVKNVRITDAYASGVATLNANTAWTPADPTLALEFGNAAVASATAEEPFANGTTVESYKELLMIPGRGATDVMDGATVLHENVYTIQFTVELLVSDQVIAQYPHTIYTDFAPQAGMSYDLKATINPENIDPANSQEAIEFTVTAITDWDNDHDGKENTPEGDDTDNQVETDLPENN